MKLKTYIVLGLAIGSGCLLLYTSQAVQDAQRQLKAAQNMLSQEKQTLRVLEAEWAFLSAPQRLERILLKSGAGDEASKTGKSAKDSSASPIIVNDLNQLRRKGTDGVAVLYDASYGKRYGLVGRD